MAVPLHALGEDAFAVICLSWMCNTTTPSRLVGASNSAPFHFPSDILRHSSVIGFPFRAFRTWIRMSCARANDPHPRTNTSRRMLQFITTTVHPTSGRGTISVVIAGDSAQNP